MAAMRMKSRIFANTLRSRLALFTSSDINKFNKES
jgi:hypothetical protein